MKDLKKGLNNILIRIKSWKEFMNNSPLLATDGAGLLIKEDLRTIPRANITPPRIIAVQQLCLSSDTTQVLSYLGHLGKITALVT